MAQIQLWEDINDVEAIRVVSGAYAAIYVGKRIG